jgi:hypothetical protein
MKQRIADVSLGFCIESVIEEGVRVLDFLSTPAAEKFHYARHVAQVLKLTLYRPRLRSLCFEALAHVGALPMASLKHLRTGRASAPEPAPAAATES